MNYNALTQDIFYIELPKDSYLLYAPLADIVCFASIEDIDNLKSYYNGETDCEVSDEVIAMLEIVDCEITKLNKTPCEYNKISIIPNYICNFSCSYCYSAKGRSKQQMELSTFTSAIDFLLDNSRSSELNRSIFITGGGEPLLSWKLLKGGIYYAKKLAYKNGLNFKISIVTNGSVFSEEIASFLSENNVNLGISYEILESLQNAQRGQFEMVTGNIRKYIDLGVNVLINSTITNLSVSHLEEMVNSIHLRFPEIAHLTMEPVTSMDIFKDAEEFQQFYTDFDIHFDRASLIAKKYGISLHTSCSNISEISQMRYCPGKLCVTPNGDITICHCASSPNEDRFLGCKYGEINNGVIEFNQNHFETLLNKNHLSYKECYNCFAKYSCGGECLNRRESYSKEFMNVVCNHNRKRLLEELLQKLEIDQYE